MIGRVTALAGLLLGALPAQAAADTALATPKRPAPVSVHAGRVVWSSFDEAPPGYSLMTLSAEGVPVRVPVARRSVPFDVDVGPDAQGQTIAAYSRCRREPRPRRGLFRDVVMPQWSTGRGCDLYQFDFTTGRETRIAPANSPRASEFLPTVWKARVAFARVYEHRKGGGGDRAYLYTRGVAGTARSRQVPAGNRSSARFCPGAPPCHVPVEPGPTALDLAGRRLAFGWDSGDRIGPSSAVYLDTIGARATRRARLSLVHSTGTGSRQLVQPVIDSGRVTWGYPSHSDFGGNELRRFSLFDNTRERLVLTPPRPGRPAQPLIALGADAGTYVYLLSTSLIGSGCTASTPPCELWLATDLAFTRLGGRRR